MDKLFEIVKKCYNDIYDYSIKKDQIFLKNRFNNSIEFIKLHNDCYFFFIKDLSPLFNFFNIKMNNEYLDIIFKKYEEIFSNYSVFSYLSTPEQNFNKDFNNLFKDYNNAKYKEVHYKYIKDSKRNIKLSFRLDKNLVPFFNIETPIHYIKSINFNIYDDISKNDLNSIYTLLESEMKKIAFKEIKSVFNKITPYQLKKMSKIEIQQHIEMCRILKY